MTKAENQSQTNSCANSTDVKKFFDQEWDLYKRVVNLNHMAHKEILEHLSRFFSSVPLPMFSVLELGCGDASLLSNALQGTKVESYCGVDISPFALEIAEVNMRRHRCKKRIIEGDLLEEAGSFEKEFDVIVAGYSFHHLTKEEKGQFFKKCKAALKLRGILVIFDEVCNPEESKSSFMKRFFRICMHEWNGLANEELLRICDHVGNYDYPETFEVYKQLAVGHGFNGSQILFQDKHNLFGMFSFSI